MGRMRPRIVVEVIIIPLMPGTSGITRLADIRSFYLNSLFHGVGDIHSPVKVNLCLCADHTGHAQADKRSN